MKSRLMVIFILVCMLILPTFTVGAEQSFIYGEYCDDHDHAGHAEHALCTDTECLAEGNIELMGFPPPPDKCPDCGNKNVEYIYSAVDTTWHSRITNCGHGLIYQYHEQVIPPNCVNPGKCICEFTYGISLGHDNYWYRGLNNYIHGVHCSRCTPYNPPYSTNYYTTQSHTFVVTYSSYMDGSIRRHIARKSCNKCFYYDENFPPRDYPCQMPTQTCYGTCVPIS